MSKNNAGKEATGTSAEFMATSMWPRCCGAKIIHEFRGGAVTPEALKKAMTRTPENQVYDGEGLNPKTTFVTLNRGQMGYAPEKILREAGFVAIGTIDGRGRGGITLFVHGPFTHFDKVA